MDVLRLRMARMVSRIVRWAVVNASGVDENPYPTQGVKYLGKEGLSQVWYPYGFNAHAPNGTLSMMFAIGGDAGSSVHMPGSPQERIKMNSGEVVMYHPASGSKVHMKDDGSIAVESNATIDVHATGQVNIESEAKVEVTAAADIVLQSTTALFISAPLNFIIGDLDISGTLQCDGAATFDDAVLVDSTIDTDGQFDVRGHVHQRSGSDTTGPYDPGDFP
jgi:phage gp45-like